MRGDVGSACEEEYVGMLTVVCLIVVVTIGAMIVMLSFTAVEFFSDEGLEYPTKLSLFRKRLESLRLSATLEALLAVMTELFRYMFLE